MGVVVTSGGQQVVVQSGQTLKSKGTRIISLTTSEQETCEATGGEPSQVTGYLDLSNMEAGDTVVVRFYGKIEDGGPWLACYEETYTGVQLLPLVYVSKRPENHGLKITVQQTTGTPKVIKFECFEES